MNNECQRYRTALLEGRRPPEHPGCGRCRDYAAELTQLNDHLRALPHPDLPRGFEFALRQRLEREEQRRAVGRRRWGWGLGFAGIAAVAGLLLMLLGPWAQPQVQAEQHVLVTFELEADPSSDEPVELHVLLPEGLRLSGEDPALGRADEFRWEEAVPASGRLRRSFALQARRTGSWTLRIEARSGDERATVETEIVVAPTSVAARSAGAVYAGAGSLRMGIASSAVARRGG